MASQFFWKRGTVWNTVKKAVHFIALEKKTLISMIPLYVVSFKVTSDIGINYVILIYII